MFDSRDNTKQVILFNYATAKNTYGIMPDTSLLRMVEELKTIDGLSEGVDLSYISHKIDQGIELDHEERNLLLTTITLHSSDKFLDESLEPVRVQ